MAENNATILNAVWLKGTNDFQQRIPQPTQSSIDRTVTALLDPMNNDCYNQFVDSLIKRIGMVKVHSDEWKNPLREFKGASMVYGSTIQEIAPKWIKAHAYNFDSSLLDVNKPEAVEWFHSINRFDKYPISINNIEIRKSFVDEFGLNNLISGFLQAPINADEYDEYRIMMQLIAEYENHWGFYKHNLTNDPLTEAGSKELMTTIRTYVGKLRYPSMNYNAGVIDVPVFVNNPSELMLLTTPEYEAYMDVNVLSSLFHVELADIDVRRIIVDEFPVPNCVALLVTKDWFICHDTVKQMDSFYDGSNLTTNYWYHRQGIYSMSPFTPCIMITYGKESTTIPVVTETVNNITLTPETATVKAGDTVQFKVKINGTLSDDVDGIEVMPDSTSYEITSSTGKCTKATYIDRYDMLHTSKTLADGTVLTVTMKSSYINPSGDTTDFTATATVTISNS
jgi:hypothetical protein